MKHVLLAASVLATAAMTAYVAYVYRADLAPKDPAEWWTAIGAVATALGALLSAVAVFYAVSAIRFAAETVRIEQTPVLLLERDHEGGHIRVRNIGRGIAFNVCVATEGDEPFWGVSAIKPDESARVDVAGNDYSLIEGNYIYGQDIEGRWHRTFAVYRGLRLSDRSDFWNRAIKKRVRRAPAAIRRHLRARERSALGHLHALESLVSIEGWAFRWERTYVRARIPLSRWWHRIGESGRVEKFARRPDSAPAGAVGANVREGWDVDVTAWVECWKGSRNIVQLGCGWEDDVLVCEILAQSGHLAFAARGILAITRSAYDGLPPERGDRNELVRRRFRRYICGLRPEGRFAYILRGKRGAMFNDVFTRWL